MQETMECAAITVREAENREVPPEDAIGCKRRVLSETDGAQYKKNQHSIQMLETGINGLESVETVNNFARSTGNRNRVPKMKVPMKTVGQRKTRCFWCGGSDHWKRNCYKFLQGIPRSTFGIQVENFYFGKGFTVTEDGDIVKISSINVTNNGLNGSSYGKSNNVQKKGQFKPQNAQFGKNKGFQKTFRRNGNLYRKTFRRFDRNGKVHTVGRLDSIDEHGNVLQNECVENCELADCSEFHDTEDETGVETADEQSQNLAPELDEFCTVDELCTLDEAEEELEWLDELCDQEFKDFEL